MALLISPLDSARDSEGLMEFAGCWKVRTGDEGKMESRESGSVIQWVEVGMMRHGV